MEEAKRDEEESKQQQIWSWGAGTEGQLGTGKLEDEYLPQLLHLPFLSSAGSISTLACGGAHAIALTFGTLVYFCIFPLNSCHQITINQISVIKSRLIKLLFVVGKVFTWGRGTTGQLGHGEMLNSLHPKPVSSLQSYVITHVSAGWSHSGFVSDTGLLFTCGDGSFGQLGLGDYWSQSTPVKVDYFAIILLIRLHVACAIYLSCLRVTAKELNFISDIAIWIAPGNQVYGFGSGKRGQLGISRDKIKYVNLSQVTCGLEDVQIVSISANGDHSAAISADGHLYTWGRGFAGAADANLPQLSLSSLRCTKAALGWNHGLLLTGDEEVLMLGGKYHGGLCHLEKMSVVKHRSDSSRATLNEVIGLDGVKVVKIAAGAEHSALVTGKVIYYELLPSSFSLWMDGSIKTWGWGEHGQLGLGNTNDQTIPQTVSLSPDIQNKEASLNVYCGSGFTFAIRSLSVNPGNIPRN
ncbi:hypothetical protein DKX38_022446 [Salix brachista]|uniref:RCC1-like domain-containing protein n=1 Tax=Salix brachista TaxID=2182728 RepID=A0A5N5KBB9_9ROSI|nr:hypothetical protein DKX38_022446 [Salix brachista]